MRAGGREEFFEEYSEDFPYLPVISRQDLFCDRSVPWHWHQEFELFYVRDGWVDYSTVHEHRVLGPGTLGLINANVLHKTCAHDGEPGVTLLIHMFRASFIAEAGSLLAQTYVEPIARATSLEMIVLDDADPATQKVRQLALESFAVAEAEPDGWELRVRNLVSELWLGFFAAVRPLLEGAGPAALEDERAERLKAMISYVSAHYDERLSVADIAASAFTSERDCHRIFRDFLGVTPAQYLRDHRIQQACRMLAHTTRPVGTIAQMTGLGTASHFGQVFHAAVGTTPSEYRASWQDFDMKWQSR